jgi:hypothetical protein
VTASPSPSPVPSHSVAATASATLRPTLVSAEALPQLLQPMDGPSKLQSVYKMLSQKCTYHNRLSLCAALVVQCWPVVVESRAYRLVPGVVASVCMRQCLSWSLSRVCFETTSPSSTPSSVLSLHD